jgi:hypothetical protein
MNFSKLQELNQTDVEQAMYSLYHHESPENPALQDLTLQEWELVSQLLVSLLEEKKHCRMQ